MEGGYRKLSYGALDNTDADGDATNDSYHLMAQSREQLTMDMTKSENSIFTRPTGCYISRAKGVCLLLAFVATAVVVAVITYNVATSESHGGTDESGSGKGPLKVTDVRLPTNVVPVFYRLDLIPHVNKEEHFLLEGKVWIDVLCKEKSDKITVHIKNISIIRENVTVTKIDEPEIPIVPSQQGTLKVVKHQLDEAREFYNFTLGERMTPGTFYRLYIPYRGNVSDSLDGFYRSSYTDKTSNETRWLAVTQFQPTDARKAFPCFDEPALKAKFQINLARQKDMTTVSNMNLEKTEEFEGKPEWVWDRYNKSVPVSTYLVAFLVSDFAHRESDRSLSKPTFRIWARKDAIDQVEYARNIGPRILTYFENYFNIAFPLPKQDMVALPDFSAGAMENWGLITYRETALLYDPKVSSDSSKVRVASVVAHELAHQWFGNLVTPSWWTDLWLNEGFASYVEFLGVDHVEPEWKMMDQFVVDEIQNVFSLDALDSSHPISVVVRHPDEINEIFDKISYSKGASVIRMMNHFLTEDSFRQGLTNYLNKWKYNSTKQDDLWVSLTEQAHKSGTLRKEMNVRDVMNTWTLQKGFPVIQVDRDYNSSKATFTQTKFQLIKNATMRDEYSKYSWWVPISYASGTHNSDFGQTDPSFWIPNKKATVTEAVNASKSDWLVVNPQQTGYYRVNYDDKNWNMIIDQLQRNASVIHVINRAQLLDDALNLARAGLLKYELAFNVTQYLKDDNEYLPWDSFLNAFGYISTMMIKSPAYGNFKSYMKNLLDNQFKFVSFRERPNESLPLKYHRINILQWACSMGHPDCIKEAKLMFANWTKTSDPNTENPVPNNIRKLVYCNAIKHGSEADWDFAWQRYKEANVASEKNVILAALTCSKETWILNRYLNWTVTEGSGIRKQDGASIIQGIANNDIGNYLAFNFLRDKWAHMRNYFGTGLFSSGRIVTAISNRLNTGFELEEMKNFKKRFQNELGPATRAVDQAIERIENNIQWMSDNAPTLSSWLDSVVMA